MKGRWLSKDRLPAVLVSAFLACMAAVWVVYGVCGHRFVRAMYEGRSPAFFNELIEGQAVHTVEHYLRFADRAFIYANVFSLLAFLLLLLLWIGRGRWLPRLYECLEAHTDALDDLPDSHIWLWIALAAGLGLYMELMIIRLHSSYVQLFAYFKNISLLSCFLGLGIGFSRGGRRPLTTPLVMPLLTAQVMVLWLLRFAGDGGLLRNPVPERIELGLETASTLVSLGTAYVFLAAVFAFNALCFIPLGQLASRLMMRREKLVSYGWNLAGSLCGILVFSFLSFLWSPPPVWIGVAALSILLFLRKNVMSLLPSLLSAFVLVILLWVPFRSDRTEVYSPYQQLTLKFDEASIPSVKVGFIYSQRILDLREDNVRHDKRLEKWVAHYAVPYRFRPLPEDVLIVGSGTGNDVAAAVRHGAGEIDAVEIDPAILEFGRSLHPEAPYRADNVSVHVDDARAYIRHAGKEYDLIVYGLLVSHTLLSGRSGARLDSYVYTVEAFREARAKLKEDGILCVTFGPVRTELGRKVFLMLQEAYDGRPPLVYQAGDEGEYVFLNGSGLTARSSRRLPPGTGLVDVTARFADRGIEAHMSTDDWPFFYMPVRKYPVSYIIIIVVLLCVSAAYIRKFMPGPAAGFSAPCFFLGAGFMLIETKGITELGLVYGSTWIVVSVVIAAILVLAFLANLLVMKTCAPRPSITYGLLCASLIAGLAVSSSGLSGFPPWMSRAVMTLALTVPLFFSGLAFSSELKKSASVAAALSSNLLGAMLGGFIEYNAMYFGFRSLYFFAIVMYGFAFLGSILRIENR